MSGFVGLRSALVIASAFLGGEFGRRVDWEALAGGLGTELFWGLCFSWYVLRPVLGRWLGRRLFWVLGWARVRMSWAWAVLDCGLGWAVFA